MTLLFCGVGVYSHRLAYRFAHKYIFDNPPKLKHCFFSARLFMHPKFVRKLRLHSKTIMKLNAAAMVFIVVLLFVVVQNLSITRQELFLLFFRLNL